MDVEFNIASDILPEVQKPFAISCLGNSGVEMLMLCDKYIVGSSGNNLMRSHLYFSVVARLPIGVIHLSILVVSKADGTILAPVPTFNCGNDVVGSIPIADLQLSKELCFRTVLVSDSPGTDTAPVLTVRQLNNQKVLSYTQLHRYIIGLVLHPLAVIRMSGCHHKITDL